MASPRPRIMTLAALALLGSGVVALAEAVMALMSPSLSEVPPPTAVLYVVVAIVINVWYVGAPCLCALFAWRAFGWVRFVVPVVAATQFIFLGGVLTWVSAMLTVLAGVLLWLPGARSSEGARRI
jgi:hypothetical protein